MLHQLANHNHDIKRLMEKGYAIGIDSSLLVIRDIPYLDENKALKIGAIVAKLVFIDKTRVQQDDHQIYFCGSHPCEIDGNSIKNLGGGSIKLPLEAQDIVVERSFSNKANGSSFPDFFEKIEHYVAIISGPAMTLYPNANPYTFRISEHVTDSVFKFNDTLTSRAEIGDLSLKFKEEVIAIIGLGGTGSYLLDFLSKTPVKEIRAFDPDWFHVHNAFRSPGKLDPDELGKRKAEVYQNRYDGFRHGINIKAKYIQDDSEADLEGVTFAFVCVDKGSSRSAIFELLIKLNIPFIDVGMGLDRTRGPIAGILRTTYYSNKNAKGLVERKLAPTHDDSNDIYKNNIQISELNALNACLAAMRYKQLMGFYDDDNGYYNLLLTINDFNCLGDNDRN